MKRRGIAETARVSKYRMGYIPHEILGGMSAAFAHAGEDNPVWRRKKCSSTNKITMYGT